MGFYYFDYTYFLFMLPALLISMVAQFKVNSTFQKYSRVNTARNMTGADAAMRVMQYGGAYGVQIRHIGGSLNDNFNPSTGIISLSDPVYAATSVSAVGVAAHEAGHAVQHAQGYFPNKIRSALVPVTQIGSRLAMPLILIGLLLPVQYDVVVNIGIALYSLSLLRSWCSSWSPCRWNSMRAPGRFRHWTRRVFYIQKSWREPKRCFVRRL